MGLQNEITVLRSLFDNVNKQSSSNAKSIAKLSQEQITQKTAIENNRVIAERALQMCDQLSQRLDQLEARLPA